METKVDAYWKAVLGGRSAGQVVTENKLPVDRAALESWLNRAEVEAGIQADAHHHALVLDALELSATLLAEVRS